MSTRIATPECGPRFWRAGGVSRLVLVGPAPAGLRRPFAWSCQNREGHPPPHAGSADAPSVERGRPARIAFLSTAGGTPALQISSRGKMRSPTGIASAPLSGLYLLATPNRRLPGKEPAWLYLLSLIARSLPHGPG